MLLGAGFALLAISFFVFGADNPPAEWGRFWMIRPLIVTPLAGAVGGAVYHFLDRLRARGNINGNVAVILSLIIYVVGLWMGIVLGLAGTMWN
jgi:hypothetical protein